MRYVVCRCVSVGVRAAALATKPVAYRGAVSVGYFAIEDNFILGPAVDEAAGLMEVADAAVVWLTPSAEKLRHDLRLPQDNWSHMVIDADVPLKDRSVSTTLRRSVSEFTELEVCRAWRLSRRLHREIDR